MLVIEPCCAERQIRQLRNLIGRYETREFEGYGDLSLTELLPAILAHYSEVDVMIVAPTIPDQAAEVIERSMRKQWARMDGKGKLNVIAHLTLVADMRRKKSPKAAQWLRQNPFADRLTLVNRQQGDTAILLPDMAITGPINLQYGNNFTATATASESRISMLRDRYSKDNAAADGTDATDSPEEQEVTETEAVTGVEENATEEA